MGFAFLSNKVQSAAFQLAPLPRKDTQDGGLSSEFFYSLHFGEGPADSELSFTLLVNRNEDIQGQDVQPLSLGQSSGSFPAVLFTFPPVGLVRLLRSPRASTTTLPLPPARPAFPPTT